MSSEQSNTPFHLSSPQSYGFSSAPRQSIRGDYSGNVGDNNIYGSGNIIHYHGDTNLYDQILQCLYRGGYEEQRKRVREAVEGTCTEHPRYKDWLETKTSGLLWLSGDPGCGKSVIASFLVKHLKTHSNATICYFFFKDDSDEQKNATFALCAILHQMFKKRNSLVRFAEKEFKANSSKFAQEVDTLWNILVKAVAEGGCGDVICVVDALDECEERTQAQLMRLLANLSGSQSSDVALKLVVTSRPYHGIERGLGSGVTTIRLKGEDEIEAITADVARVIDEGIKDLESYWEPPGGLGDLRGVLESSADRTFIWVSLVLEILKGSEDGSPEEFANIASSAPRDLAELYTKILDKSRNHKKARRILDIVVAATRPLTLREMNIAFNISRDRRAIKDLRHPTPGFEKTLKNLCGHFVRVIDSKIYLVHQTAREFLIKGSSPGIGNWQYTLCHQDSHFALADICISYLALEEFEDDPQAIDADGYVQGKAVENYDQKYGFLDYAARNWADHFRDSQHRQMELLEFTGRICEAGSKRFQTWLQVYWFHSQWWDCCPQDWTHLIMAAWLGQRGVVEWLLEGGGDVGARYKRYGTVLNIAALRGDGDMTGALLQKNVKAYISGKEYNILRGGTLLYRRSGTRELLTSGSLSVEKSIRIDVSEQDPPRFWDEGIADLWLAE
ncbi:NACHT-ANK domain protein transcript variant 3 [Tuber magnatum]|uniref:NACHT-ANK domain protein transcript variant 3 n=1 Tax=Tuber magnatum TaxID=42249 RepID=A0A317SP48_9PEZI|nr:NACHT-ANK domain protein transcript variant 3 [Tuber magnatum]